MAFHHRKLLNESAAVDPETVAKHCDLFCDSTRKPVAVCPSKCLDFCPQFCITSLSLIPPPLPSPETPLPVFTAPPYNKHYTLPIFLTVSLAILAATFLFFTCYTIYRFHSAWRNSRRRPSHPSPRSQPDEFLDEDQGPVVDHHVWYIRTVGLQPSVISAITIVKYSKGDGLIEGTDCSVCLNEFEEDETLRLLPKCNHAFHIPCIDTWLRSHTNCPMCRAPIVNEAPSQEPAVQNSGPAEETRVQLENQPSELRIEVEDEGDSGDRGGLDGIQPMRRSVSLDSLSAKMISSAIANGFSGQLSDDTSSDNIQVGVVEKTDGTDQSLSSMQTGSSSMKRSLSCSAKVFLSRHSSKNRNSVIPQ